MKGEAGGGWITICHAFQGHVVSFYKGVHGQDLERNVLSGVWRGNTETSGKAPSWCRTITKSQGWAKELAVLFSVRESSDAFNHASNFLWKKVSSAFQLFWYKCQENDTFVSPPKLFEVLGIRGTANKVWKVKQITGLSVSEELVCYIDKMKCSICLNHIRVGRIFTFTICPVKPHLFIIYHFTLVVCTLTFAGDQNTQKAHILTITHPSIFKAHIHLTLCHYADDIS